MQGKFTFSVFLFIVITSLDDRNFCDTIIIE